ncbi:hypothetical protein [Streptomyces sp. P17]|uniref:hypothetical protein n=1 Tax=Streptomyces sp. P17 TaxID=3074716 RepID=UPI0028F435CD|nr:hypothetical protein [Streptomyces sp. P17]MDT9699283.1 hypothetical protein [Streptomyces sp. P17]
MAESAEKEKGEDESGSEFATLDSLVPEVWPEGFTEALDAWQQGHLLPGSTLSWAAPYGLDAVTGIETDNDGEVEASSAEWCHVSVDDLRYQWVIVTSQTCDVAAYGPGARHPLVQVSPVMLMPSVSDNQRTAIERHEVAHFVSLSKPPAEGFWVVDLRVSVPVSKHLLVVNSPLSAFASEQDLLDFSEHVAARIRRPSLHDIVSGDMVKSIGQYIKSTNRGDPDWWEQVEQLRVLITGTRLSPSSIQLIVVQQTELNAKQKKIWRDWAPPFRKVLKRERISLSPLHFTTLDVMKARIYKESIPLRVPELLRPHLW